MKNTNDNINIIVGTLIFSLGITWFSDPAGLVAGGITGIAIVLKDIFNIPLFLTNLILNIPLFLISIKQRGWKFIKKSALGVTLLSLFLALTKYIPNPFFIENDLLMAALGSGVLIGAGLGYILRSSATSGGTDMLAAIIKYKKPHFPISTLILVADALIILVGMTVFGIHKGLYAILSLTVTTVILDKILEGIHFAKAAYIFSEKYEEISREIFDKLGRGNTAIYAKGMYKKEDKKILYVIVGSKETIALQKIVKSIDPDAFMSVNDIRQALGKGFTDFKYLDEML